jgi:CP family cyanate transporter-like MFS transporter
MVGLIFWLFIQPKIKNKAQAPGTSTTGRVTYWNNSRSWSLLFFFGVGTGAFMLILAWLPAFYVSLGKSREFSGYLLASFTLIELITAFIISILINRYPDRRGPLLLSLMLVIAGLACLIVAPLTLTWVAISLLGIGIGLLFPLSLIITMDHVNDPKQAGDFSAFVTGGGYIIASTMPFFAGWIRDYFSDLTHAWLLMGGGVCILIVLAIRYSPASYIHFRDQSKTH